MMDVNQNVDQISREIAYVPLSERIRSKRSHACKVSLFSYKKIIKRKHKCRTYLPDVKENGGPKIKFERLEILNIVVGEKLIDSLVKRLENKVERLFNHEIGKLKQSRETLQSRDWKI